MSKQLSTESTQRKTGYLSVPCLLLSCVWRCNACCCSCIACLTLSCCGLGFVVLSPLLPLLWVCCWLCCSTLEWSWTLDGFLSVQGRKRED